MLLMHVTFDRIRQGIKVIIYNCGGIEDRMSDKMRTNFQMSKIN